MYVKIYVFSNIFWGTDQVYNTDENQALTSEVTSSKNL